MFGGGLMCGGKNFQVHIQVAEHKYRRHQPLSRSYDQFCSKNLQAKQGGLATDLVGIQADQRPS